MSPQSQMEMDREELQASSEALPFNRLHIEEFDDPSFDPPQIRQERRYGRPDSQTQPITRFLAERGRVEILSSENLTTLFTEIHWCCHHLRLMAETESDDAEYWADALQRSFRFIERMEAAEEEIFIANRQLVVACVKPFYWIGQIWISDFLQEGSRALANAIRKFDFTRGVPFYAYAQRSIQNRLRNFFRDHIRTGALGMRPSHDMTRLRECMEKWQHQHGEEPSPIILSELCELPVERVQRLLPLIRQWQRMPNSPMSLDALLGDSRSSLHDLVADHTQRDASQEAEHSELWDLIAELPERLQIILKRRFIEGRTLEEVGEEFDLTRARIKQLQDEALQKLRTILRRTRNR